MRSSEWSSDVCSSDLHPLAAIDIEEGNDGDQRLVGPAGSADHLFRRHRFIDQEGEVARHRLEGRQREKTVLLAAGARQRDDVEEDFEGHGRRLQIERPQHARVRSEEHTSELQSLMRTSYAVFCLKKKNTIKCDRQSILH